MCGTQTTINTLLQYSHTETLSWLVANHCCFIINRKEKDLPQVFLRHVLLKSGYAHRNLVKFSIIGNTECKGIWEMHRSVLNNTDPERYNKCASCAAVFHSQLSEKLPTAVGVQYRDIFWTLLERKLIFRKQDSQNMRLFYFLYFTLRVKYQPWRLGEQCIPP